MSRLSIVIPWWDEHPALEDTLVSVLQHRPRHSEILVAHNRPYHDPWQLTGEVIFLPCGADSELDLIHGGIDASRAPLVHVLRCGMEATEGWTDAPVSRLESDTNLAGIAPLIVGRGATPRIAAGLDPNWRGGRRRLVRAAGPDGSVDRQPIGPTLAAGFYRRESLVRAGRFSAEFGVSWADLDLALTFRSMGLASAVEPASRVLGDAGPDESRGFSDGRRGARFVGKHERRCGTGVWITHVLAVIAGYARRPTWTVPFDMAGRCIGFAESVRGTRHRGASAEPEPEPVVVRPFTDGRPTAGRRAA
ncbi:MAG: hypothetical protein FJ297_17600 [Planctomycetes bacterium]|nr:hypothetical protein [Planctomycetota bacterium]